MPKGDDQYHELPPGFIVRGKGSHVWDAEIDRAAFHVLKQSAQGYEIIEFHPYGYDERQYCLPRFNLQVGRFSQTPFAEYPEYHTSADDLNFVHSEFLRDSFSKLLSILHIVENNRTYQSLNMMCEPQLGNRGLHDEAGDGRMGMLWVMSLSNRKHSLLDIADLILLRSQI